MKKKFSKYFAPSLNDARKRIHTDIKNVNFEIEEKYQGLGINKKYMVNVIGMSSMIEACHVDIVSMASELASELDLYGIILDVIEPVLKKHKDADDKAKSEEKAKMEAEEAKRIEQEKEANTQRIEIVHKKA